MWCCSGSINLFSGEMCLFIPVLVVSSSSLVFRLSSSSLSLSLTLSLCVCVCVCVSPLHEMPCTKICYSEFRVPCFLIWWSASRPRPSSCCERGACTDRRRSLFASIFGSEATHSRGEGRGGVGREWGGGENRGEEGRREEGWQRVSFHPENRLAIDRLLNVGWKQQHNSFNY